MESASQVRKVIVVGGGIGGLAAAWELTEEAKRQGLELEVRLLEASGRVGGSIRTDRVDDCLIEAGPDCIVSEKPWGVQLIEDVGLGDQLAPTNDADRRTYVLWKGKLHPLPDGLILLVPTKVTPFVTASLFSWPGKFRMALDLVLPKRKTTGDETLGDFIRRRLGREALDKLGEPLVAGIHSGDPETMSVASTFPRFLQMEQEERSLILAMLRRMRAVRRARERAAAEIAAGSGDGSGAPRRQIPRTMFITLRRGLEELVAELARRLGDERIELGQRVTGMRRAANGRWEVTKAEGEAEQADAVILATPAHVTAEILACLAPGVAAELREMPYVSSATVTLAYRREDVPISPGGFGTVIPKGEARRIKAFTWVTTKFFERAPADTVLMRCFVRVPPGESVPSQDELRRIAARELTDILGLPEPLWARAYRWERAMPQYVVGHGARVERVEAALAELPGLVLAGGAYHGSGIPDTVRVGRERARELVTRLRA